MSNLSSASNLKSQIRDFLKTHKESPEISLQLLRKLHASEAAEALENFLVVKSAPLVTRLIGHVHEDDAAEVNNWLLKNAQPDSKAQVQAFKNQDILIDQAMQEDDYFKAASLAGSKLYHVAENSEQQDAAMQQIDAAVERALVFATEEDQQRAMECRMLQCSQYKGNNPKRIACAVKMGDVIDKAITQGRSRWAINAIKDQLDWLPKGSPEYQQAALRAKQPIKDLLVKGEYQHCSYYIQQMHDRLPDGHPERLICIDLMDDVVSGAVAAKNNEESVRILKSQKHMVAMHGKLPEKFKAIRAQLEHYEAKQEQLEEQRKNPAILQEILNEFTTNFPVATAQPPKNTTSYKNE